MLLSGLRSREVPDLRRLWLLRSSTAGSLRNPPTTSLEGSPSLGQIDSRVHPPSSPSSGCRPERLGLGQDGDPRSTPPGSVSDRSRRGPRPQPRRAARRTRCSPPAAHRRLAPGETPGSSLRGARPPRGRRKPSPKLAEHDPPGEAGDHRPLAPGGLSPLLEPDVGGDQASRTTHRGGHARPHSPDGCRESHVGRRTHPRQLLFSGKYPVRTCPCQRFAHALADANA